MENQIYRVSLDDNAKLEFYVATCVSEETKEKELGIIVLGKDGLQLDAGLEDNEIDSLIDYLQDMQRHCRNFNKEQKELQKSKV